MVKRIIFLCLISCFLWSSPVWAKNPVLLLPGINSDSEQVYKKGCLITTLKNAGESVANDF
ncbi:MAG: hypothetical protein AB1414_20955 [bacterium]